MGSNLNLIIIILLFYCIHSNKIESQQHELTEEHPDNFKFINDYSEIVNSNGDQPKDEFFYIDKSDWENPWDLFGEETNENEINIKNNDVKNNNDKKNEEEKHNMNLKIVDKDNRNDNVQHDNIQHDNVQNEKQNCSSDKKNLMKCKDDLNKLKDKSFCNQRINQFTIRAFKKFIQKMVVLVSSYHDSGDLIEISSNVKYQTVKSIDNFIKRHLETCKNIEDLEVLIIEIINNISIVNQEERQFYDSNNSQFNIYLLALIAIISIYPLQKFVFSRKIIFISLLIIVSVAWEWMLLYQKEIVEHYSTTTHAPEECVFGQDKNKTFISNFLSAISSLLNPPKEKCKEYYTAMIVNPIYKVNPLEAASSLFSKTIFKPLRYFGQELGHFYNNLFVNMPWYLKIVMTITMPLITIFIFIVFIFAFFGYSFKLPFFLGTIFRPALPTPSSSSLHQRQQESLPQPQQESLPSPQTSIRKIQNQSIQTESPKERFSRMIKNKENRIEFKNCTKVLRRPKSMNDLQNYR